MRHRYSHSRYRIAESVSFTQEEFFLAKHRRHTIYRDEIKVKCGANFHRIRLNFPGPIELLNHTDRKQEQMLMKLGGDKPDCLHFLEQWSSGQWQRETTRPLVTKFSVAKDRMTSSRSLVKSSNLDWLDLPIYDRLRKRLGQVYNLVMAKLDEKFNAADNPVYRHHYHSPTVDAPNGKHDEVLVPRMRLEFVDVKKSAAKVQDI